MMAVAISAAAPKNAITLSRPSISSPISLAKPITWIRTVGDCLLLTVLSSAFASSYLARILSSSTRESPW